MDVIQAINAVVRKMWWALLIACFLLVGYIDKQEAEIDLEAYCGMVKLHKENPTTGWPDYRGIYDSECSR